MSLFEDPKLGPVQKFVTGKWLQRFQGGKDRGPSPAHGFLMAQMVALFVALAMLISSCAKMPGFQAEDYNFKPAAVTPESPANTGSKDDAGSSEPTPGSLVRTSKRIKLIPGKSKWENQNTKLTMMAAVTVDGHSWGDVEFQGTKQNSSIALTPVDPKLKEKIQAQLFCTDDGICKDFFIDVLYREKDVVYHDQMLAFPKEEVNQDPNPATPPAAPAQMDESFEFINKDLLDTTGHMGISEDEALKKFGIVAPDKKKSKKKKRKNIYIEIQDDAIPEIEIIPPVEETEGSAPAPGVPQPAQPPASPSQTSQAPPPTLPAPPPSSPAPAPAPVPSTPSKTPAPAPVPTPSTPPSVHPPIGKGDNVVVPSTPMHALEKFRKSDMSVNWPFTYTHPKTKKRISGRLDRGINFRELVSSIPGINFQVGSQTIHNFGSFYLAQVVTYISQAMKTILPGRALTVTSISKVNGGVSNLHASHQNGNDIDVLFLRNNEKADPDIVVGQRVSTNFLVKEQWQLTKKAFQTGQVQVIFMDRAVKKALCEHAISIGDYKRGVDSGPIAEMFKHIIHVDGHQNHFHIRVLCSPDDPGCQEVPYDTKKMPVGC